MNNPADRIFAVRDLRLYFGSEKTPSRAIEGMNLMIPAGKTTALVGESGCGKSLTALSLTGLAPVPPGRYVDGMIEYRGRDVLSMSSRELRALRGRGASYIFQEPSASLNPVIRVGEQIAEAVRTHEGHGSIHDRVLELTAMTGLPQPERIVRAYPFELSGGMQQRVMIAMALASRPELLIADEPTTALDVTIQGQILQLLTSLQKKLQMAILLITHNLAIVSGMAHSMHVMYAGRIVESGPAKEVIDRPMHPYTRALLAAIPRLDAEESRLEGIPGRMPDPKEWPSGCPFHPRCTLKIDRCISFEPPMEKCGKERQVACHRWREI